MSNIKLSKEETIKQIYELQEKIGYDCSITSQMLKSVGLFGRVINRWKSMSNMKIELGLPNENGRIKCTDTKEEMIDKFRNFYQQNGFFPTFNNLKKNYKKYGLPSIHAVEKLFSSWYELQEACGAGKGKFVKDENGLLKKAHNNPEFLKQMVIDAYHELGKRPTVKYLEQTYGMKLCFLFGRYFGSYTECVDSISEIPKKSFTDEELDKYFMDFVEKHGRPPLIKDFTDTQPTYSIYANRFGSWGQTYIRYGFKPHGRNIEYYLSDGEKCASHYEFEFSKWLKDNKFVYERDIPYSLIDKQYTGLMNCDYKIISRSGIIWYVELAGFINSTHEDKYSDEGQIYLEKIQKKERMLLRNSKHYKIYYGDDLKYLEFDRLFECLFK